MSKFKVGDRVRINFGAHRTGMILSLYPPSTLVDVALDIGLIHTYSIFSLEHEEKIEDYEVECVI